MFTIVNDNKIGGPIASNTGRGSMARSVAILPAPAVLDRHSYEPFALQAIDLYEQGQRRLLIDLRQTVAVELSGLFALHSIARVYSGDALLDAENGWEALQAAALQVTPAMSAAVKALGPSTHVAQTIQAVSFCRFLEFYDSVERALAAFITIYPN